MTMRDDRFWLRGGGLAWWERLAQLSDKQGNILIPPSSRSQSLGVELMPSVQPVILLDAQADNPFAPTIGTGIPVREQNLPLPVTGNVEPDHEPLNVNIVKPTTMPVSITGQPIAVTGGGGGGGSSDVPLKPGSIKRVLRGTLVDASVPTNGQSPYEPFGVNKVVTVGVLEISGNPILPVIEVDRLAISVSAGVPDINSHLFTHCELGVGVLRCQTANGTTYQKDFQITNFLTREPYNPNQTGYYKEDIVVFALSYDEPLLVPARSVMSNPASAPGEPLQFQMLITAFVAVNNNPGGDTPPNPPMRVSIDVEMHLTAYPKWKAANVANDHYPYTGQDLYVYDSFGF